MNATFYSRHPYTRTLIALAVLAALLATGSIPAVAAASTRPYLVKDINTSGDSRPAWLTPMGDMLFFVAKGGNKGRELWKSDGTPTGTVRVKDIRPGSAASSPQYLAVANGLLWFNADDGVHGRELWVSDGTSRGSRMVKDIRPGSGSSEPSDFVAVNGTVYFGANNGTTDRDLWRSDGTAAGTQRVKDLAWGAPASFLSCCAAIGNRIFFIQYNPYTGTDRLYVTNGTAKGTKPFRDDSGDLIQGTIGGLTVIGGLLYFGYDEALWRSDGTSAGTRKLADVSVRNIVGVGSTAFIGTYDSLWTSDGTVGTTRVTYNQPTHAYAMYNLGSRLLFFPLPDHEPGSQAWTTDGTASGTGPVGAQVTPNREGVVLDGVAYFGGYSEEGSGPSTCFFESSFLWRSDGTADGTHEVSADFDYCLGDLTAAGNGIFFVADDGAHGSELWRYVP